MEGSPQDSHLAVVGNLLFDGGAATPDEHLTVIHKALGEQTYGEQRREVRDYAREHLYGDALNEIELTMAEASANDIDLRTQNNTYRNTERVHETLDGVVHVLRSPSRLHPSSYVRMSKLVEKVMQAELNPYSPGGYGCHYNASSDDLENNPLLTYQPPKERGLVATLSRQVRESITGKTDRSYRRTKEETEHAWRTLNYMSGVTSLAVDILERAGAEMEDTSEVFDGETPQTYLRLAKWASNPYRGYGRQKDLVASSQELVDTLLDRAVSLIDADDPNAVENCLYLYKDNELQYSKREQMIFKAVDITRHSSREPRVSQVRSKFGFKRTVTEPSLFEARRSLLEKQLSDNMYHYVQARPDVVRAITDLYDNGAEAAELGELWERYAAEIADYSFTNGHYSPENIQYIPAMLAQFRRVAPEEVAQRTERQVKERLARSTAKN
jgi:hypothetical protein